MDPFDKTDTSKAPTRPGDAAEKVASLTREAMRASENASRMHKQADAAVARAEQALHYALQQKLLKPGFSYVTSVGVYTVVADSDGKALVGAISQMATGDDQ